ncbi:MAG: hypothetical protein Q9220_001429 [cf. Caloplaca sp. 1 TL-2023]
MSLQNLNLRLQPLFDAYRQTIHLIQRLSKFSATPGTSILDPEANDARIELSNEIHQSLKEQEEELELVRQEAEDLTNTASWTAAARPRDSERESERTILAAQVARLSEDLKLAHSQFRKAQLQAKRNVDAARRKERELLFAGSQEGGVAPGQGRRKNPEQLSKNQLELNASADVTSALRRVHSLMQSEVSRSQFALETLHQSTAALSTLSESYTNLDTLLSSSRSLVSSLLHSQKSDTWYLESAFWILVVTIAWLVFRRILYGPGWWLFYLPTYLGWRIIYYAAQLTLGISASLAGYIGADNQNTTITEPLQYSTSTVGEYPSGKGDLPKFGSGMSAPSIQVGGGGRGQPPRHAAHSPKDENKSISDRVGEMAEKTVEAIAASSSAPERADQETVLRARKSEEAPNPKKRMWEEETAEPEEQRSRDEL